jgi:mitogen-activated protein kinase organizer 1
LDVAIFNDNSTFVSCGGDKEVFLWDVTAARILRKFEGHTHRVNTVTFNKDDSVLISGSYDQTIRLWDMRSRSREPIQILSDCKDSVSSVDVSEYDIVAGSVDGHLRTYDIRTGEYHSDNISKPITNVCISHDNRCVVASVLGGAVALVDKASGNILHTYQGHLHENYSMQSSLIYNDSYILSGSEDGHAYVYDLLSGDVVDKLVGHSKAVIGIAAHPKEMKIITSSLDGTAIFWEENAN